MQYSSGKGVFDVDFVVKKGQTIGFLGPNGAGKTTTIRCILGFMRGQKGQCFIDGKECFTNASENMKEVGYIAGEPAFPGGMTGIEYLNFLCEVRGIKDKGWMHTLIAYFEFDPKVKIKQMSKGMKQKTAIVAAFMHDPEVLILDEPSSGLDPLMQNKFVELILSEKSKGKTILMSSHMFDEVEKTCENIIIVKDGRIVARDSVSNLKKLKTLTFIVNGQKHSVLSKDVDKFIKQIAKTKVETIQIVEPTLENIFLDLFKKEGGK